MKVCSKLMCVMNHSANPLLHSKPLEVLMKILDGRVIRGQLFECDESGDKNVIFVPTTEETFAANEVTKMIKLNPFKMGGVRALSNSGRTLDSKNDFGSKSCFKIYKSKATTCKLSVSPSSSQTTQTSCLTQCSAKTDDSFKPVGKLNTRKTKRKQWYRQSSSRQRPSEFACEPLWLDEQLIQEFRDTLHMDPITRAAHSSIPLSRFNIFLRKRAMTQSEEIERNIDTVTIPTHDSVIFHEVKVKPNGDKHLDHKVFKFDLVFNEQCTNELIYRHTASKLVEFTLEGGFATCIAYGAGISGKTHTIFGSPHLGYHNGMFAMLSKDLFRTYEESKFDENYYLTMSFCAIHGRRVTDLLQQSVRVMVMDKENDRTTIIGLREVEVLSYEDAMVYMRLGLEEHTNSQQSHAFVRLELKHRKDKMKQTHGSIILLDLANSELSDTEGKDTTEVGQIREIGKSFVCLKTLLQFVNGGSVKIDYRSSKLLLLLRSSFDGRKRQKSCFISTITPSSHASKQTLSTLEFFNKNKYNDMQPTAEDSFLRSLDLKHFESVVNSLHSNSTNFKVKNNEIEKSVQANVMMENKENDSIKEFEKKVSSPIDRNHTSRIPQLKPNKTRCVQSPYNGNSDYLFIDLMLNGSDVKENYKRKTHRCQSETFRPYNDTSVLRRVTSATENQFDKAALPVNSADCNVEGDFEKQINKFYTDYSQFLIAEVERGSHILYYSFKNRNIRIHQALAKFKHQILQRKMILESGKRVLLDFQQKLRELQTILN